jgi:hypothetical protein
MSQSFLALVGSQRANNTSGHFARHLADGFSTRGWQTKIFTAAIASRQPDQMADLRAAFETAEVIGIITPLYVDSLPSELTQVLEHLASQPPPRPGRLFAVVNSGFFEAHHNDVALDMCRLFARDAGRQWAGGLAVGGGGLYAGKPSAKLSRPAQRLIRHFDETVAALVAGRDLPASVITGVRQPAIPAWLYWSAANLSMILSAARRGGLFHLAARPFSRRA